MGGDPTTAFQPVQSRIERALLNPQHLARDLLDTLGNGPAMQRFQGEGPENEQVECALWKVDVFGGHVPLLLLHEDYNNFL